MEINKCLQDPNTVYSDQYMPLAMMPAVIEAIQQGGGTFVFGSTFNESTGQETLNKTAQEIIDALLAGKMCIIKNTESDPSNGYCYAKIISGSDWDTTCASFYAFDEYNSRLLTYTSSSLSGYPATTDE